MPAAARRRNSDSDIDDTGRRRPWRRRRASCFTLFLTGRSQTVDVSRFSIDRFERGELAWDEAMIQASPRFP